MPPEYEVELLDAMLAERRRQIEADIEASAVRAATRRGLTLFDRLYSLFRFDQTQLPASHHTVLRTQGNPSR